MTPRSDSVSPVVLVLDVASCPARRDLGPLAWAVLEDVALVVDPDAGTASTSIRAVAERLGISKDTAQRGFAILRRLGIIESMPPGRCPAGRFGRAVYRVNLPDGLRLDRSHSDAADSHVRRAVRAEPGDQGHGTASVELGAPLTLFDLA